MSATTIQPDNRYGLVRAAMPDEDRHVERRPRWTRPHPKRYRGVWSALTVEPLAPAIDAATVGRASVIQTYKNADHRSTGG